MTDLLIYWLHMVKMYPLTAKTNIPFVNVMYKLYFILFVSSVNILDFTQVNLSLFLNIPKPAKLDIKKDKKVIGQLFFKCSFGDHVNCNQKAKL